MNFRDGYDRIFSGVPKMNAETKKMLREYRDAGNYRAIMIFFSTIMKYDNDRSEFLTREVMRGNI